ncbi:MAG: hypothetical protein ACE5MM_04615 [Nitrospiraceae bacterium]
MSSRTAQQLVLNLVAPATCANCGAHNLEVFYTSPREGFHLCPACFESRVVRRVAEEAQPS